MVDAHQSPQITAKQSKRIPDDTDYASIATLSLEAREKLGRIRPTTIGQAARIGGVNPTDIANLLIHLEVRLRQTPQDAFETDTRVSHWWRHFLVC